MTSNEVDKTVASSDGKAAVEAVLTEVHRDMFRFLVRRLGDEHEAAETLEALRGLGEAQEALEAMEQGARAFDEPVREGAQ